MAIRRRAMPPSGYMRAPSPSRSGRTQWPSTSFVPRRASARSAAAKYLIAARRRAESSSKFPSPRLHRRQSRPRTASVAYRGPDKGKRRAVVASHKLRTARHSAPQALRRHQDRRIPSDDGGVARQYAPSLEPCPGCHVPNGRCPGGHRSNERCPSVEQTRLHSQAQYTSSACNSPSVVPPRPFVDDRDSPWHDGSCGHRSTSESRYSGSTWRRRPHTCAAAWVVCSFLQEPYHHDTTTGDQLTTNPYMSTKK